MHHLAAPHLLHIRKTAGTSLREWTTRPRPRLRGARLPVILLGASAERVLQPGEKPLGWTERQRHTARIENSMRCSAMNAYFTLHFRRSTRPLS
jgi:hypothetical protein